MKEYTLECYLMDYIDYSRKCYYSLMKNIYAKKLLPPAHLLSFLNPVDCTLSIRPVIFFVQKIGSFKFGGVEPIRKKQVHLIFSKTE
jgi:hypothetical protein